MTVIDVLSRGETRIRRQIGTFFESVIPGYIDLLVSQNDDLTAQHMPYPKEYLCYDPLVGETHPTLGAFVAGAHDYNVLEVTSTGAIEYEVKYEATLFATAMTANLGVDDQNLPVWEKPYRDSAIRQRDDLLNLMISAIMESPSLGTADGHTGFLLEAELTEMRKSTPEPIKLGDERNPRWAATGLILVNLKCVDNTAPPILGTANEFNNTFNIVDGEFQD